MAHIKASIASSSTVTAMARVLVHSKTVERQSQLPHPATAPEAAPNQAHFLPPARYWLPAGLLTEKLRCCYADRSRVLYYPRKLIAHASISGVGAGAIVRRVCPPPPPRRPPSPSRSSGAQVGLL